MLSLCCWGWVSGQLRYSVVEESEPGTLVGNVAQDLGLKVTDLLSRRLRLGSEENGHFFSLSLMSGALAVNQKIDRESLCGASTSCLLPIQVVTEHPLELIRVEVEILDLNDNSPAFATPEREIRISESAALGARFPLDSAQDPDVGTNTVSFYTLSPSSHFFLNVKTLKDGKLFPELVLEQQLDRETQQAPPNTDWRFSQAQRPGTSGSQNGDETGTWPNNQFDTEMLQAMILASASEAADGGSTLGGGAGTMGLSARYGPQFTLQHVPDYRQNVYIPGSNATLTNAAGKRDGKAPAGGNGNKKKSGKKEKK
ncbi:protocadherin gamma-C5 isoform X11 [Suricata suricatta]|uniref:protocadherin gamma-C5 isoform X11 n=1 Tax=Suricata suricatta TaxID=37032 RepID=UPI0011554408|nr:protocadherin gamma-C5 isoform X11 [Suricata suricatta]